MATQLPEGMVQRIKNIITTPATEWDRIDAEPMTEKGIFTGWVLPLAAIGPIAGFIGSQLFGYGAFGFTFKPSLTSSLTTAVVSYVLAIVGVWVMAKVIDALAPTFNGTRNALSATKLVAFSYTAAFLAGIFGIIPSLGILGILGIYSLYLLYLGIPKLMKCPADKALPYTAVSIVVAIIVYLVVGALASAITRPLMTPAITTDAGTISVPGLGTVDTGKLDAAAKQLEAAGKQAEAAATGATGAVAAGNGAVKPIEPAKLAALLPASAAGWTRSSIESSGMGAGGVSGGRAEGSYALGGDTARLSVTDMGAMGALAALGSAFNVQSEKTTQTGYEKTGQVDGRMTSESWDGNSRDGKYSTVVANRFVVEVQGTAKDMNTLKALAASVDLDAVADLGK